MKWQMERIILYLEQLPVHVVRVDGIEADDTIAFISKQYFENRNNKVRIVSTDRDFMQLVSPQIEIYSPVKKLIYTPDKVRQEIGTLQENYLIYRVLTGDNSDNIPGVAGLGLASLIKAFPSITSKPLTIDYIFDYCKKNKSQKKIYEKILESKDQIEINYKIMQLAQTDISDEAKAIIQENIDTKPQRVNRMKFKQLIYEDKLTTMFKNHEDWLKNSFNNLDTWIT